MTPTTRTASRSRLLWLAIPVLLALAAAVNWGSISAIASGQKSLRSVVYGVSDGGGKQIGGWKLPPNSGDKAAKVKVEVFLGEGDPCHAQTAFTGGALSSIDPKRIAVVFVNTRSGKEAIARRDKVALGCEQGFAVNGKAEFKVPNPENPAKPKTVFLTSHDTIGEGGGLLANLYGALDQELKKAYKGKGLAMTSEEFVTRLRTGIEEARNAEVARHTTEAEQAKAGGK